MRVLMVPDLLQIWESGLTATAVQRALLLLTAVYPDNITDELAQISIGQRNKQLLLLREALFGHWLEGVISCPQCHDRLELQFSTRDLLGQDALPVVEPRQHSTVEIDTYRVQFRNPNSLDIATVPSEATMEEARNHLLARCILEISNKAAPVSWENIPETVVQRVVTMMAEQEPLADCHVALHCPSCEHSWNAFFDIVSYLWTEIERWAAEILQEVHILASAYGWHEDDILGMSSWRRQLYLEKILS